MKSLFFMIVLAMGSYAQAETLYSEPKSIGAELVEMKCTVLADQNFNEGSYIKIKTYKKNSKTYKVMIEQEQCLDFFSTEVRIIRSDKAYGTFEIQKVVYHPEDTEWRLKEFTLRQNSGTVLGL